RKYVSMAGDPDPDVDPVDPVDPEVGAATLTNKLKTAFKQEAATEKVTAPALADLYAKYAVESELKKYTTWGALETAMRTDAKTFGVAGSLIKTQTVIHDFL